MPVRPQSGSSGKGKGFSHGPPRQQRMPSQGSPYRSSPNHGPVSGVHVTSTAGGRGGPRPVSPSSGPPPPNKIIYPFRTAAERAALAQAKREGKNDPPKPPRSKLLLHYNCRDAMVLIGEGVMVQANQLTLPEYTQELSQIQVNPLFPCPSIPLIPLTLIVFLYLHPWILQKRQKFLKRPKILQFRLRVKPLQNLFILPQLIFPPLKLRKTLCKVEFPV